MTGNYDLLIDWFVVDKHTSIGKNLGSTRTDFVLEGAKVENQDRFYFNDLLHQVYIEG